MPRLLKDFTIMKYFNKYYQPAEDLQFFSRTSLWKLFENAGYAVYLLADESNPNNSPFIGIEHVDDINGYICDVIQYNGIIEYELINNNVCNIINLEEIIKIVHPVFCLISDVNKKGC